MEEVLLRFSDIGEAILDLLNEKSLQNCKKVDRAWKNFIESPNQKFLWIQIIKKHEKDLIIKNYITGGPNRIWNKLKINDLRDFAKTLNEYLPAEIQRRWKDFGFSAYFPFEERKNILGKVC